MPDRNNHGGMDYLPWLLSQLKQTGPGAASAGCFHRALLSAGRRVRQRHLYRNATAPQPVHAVAVGSRTTSMKPGSTTQVKLIPRLRDWANTYYFPGTPIGITEYNWGAEGHINGATTQADILGIFGREGLDLAARWTTPDPSTPTYKAIKMYRNYDGAKSAFGDTSVSASVPNPDNVSAFAALRSSDGALTVMVISKYLTGSTPASLHLSQFAAGTAAHVWQLTASNAIQHLADVPVPAAPSRLSCRSKASRCS